MGLRHEGFLPYRPASLLQINSFTQNPKNLPLRIRSLRREKTRRVEEDALCECRGKSLRRRQGSKDTLCVNAMSDILIKIRVEPGWWKEFGIIIAYKRREVPPVKWNRSRLLSTSSSTRYPYPFQLIFSLFSFNGLKKNVPWEFESTTHSLFATTDDDRISISRPLSFVPGINNGTQKIPQK